MKKTLLLIVVSIMLLCNIQAQTYLAYTATPPIIDGTIDPVWAIAPTSSPNIIMNADPLDTEAEGIPVGKQQLENPAGTWKAMYDETNLYFLVQVNDLAPANIRGAGFYYAGDGVEIFLSKANGTSQAQYGFGYQVGAPKSYGAATNALVQKTIVNVPGVGWVLEVSIPRTLLGILATDSQIKMELGINQSSTGNKRSAQILTWNNSNTHYNSSALYHITDLACDEAVTLASDLTVGTKLCQGNSVNLTATLVDGSLTPGLNYVWEKNEGSGWVTVTSSPTATSIDETPSITTQYRVTYEMRTSCTLTIDVATSPTVSNIDYVCNNNDNTDISLTATAINGTAPFEYSLDAITYQASNVFAVNAAGDYTITVKDDNDCVASLLKTVAMPTLTLNSSGDLNIQYTVPTSQLLTAISASASSYVWTKNDAVITGESADNYTINIDESYINTTNVYKVNSVASTGCISNEETLNLTVNQKIILPTAIDITATGVANGNNIFAAQKGTELYVFNRYGITVYEESVSDASGLNGWNGCWNGEAGKEVDLGVYFYVLTTSTEKIKGTIEVVKTK